MVDQLATTAGGFDYEIDADLAFNIYYPQRGAVTAVVLEYGSTVLSAQRTLDTSTFANVIAYSGDSSLSTVEVQATTFGAAGTWESAVGDTAILDQTTLMLKAEYELAKDEILGPSYSLVLNNQSGWWTPDTLWLGDTALVVVNSGRISDQALEARDAGAAGHRRRRRRCGDDHHRTSPTRRAGGTAGRSQQSHGARGTFLKGTA